MPQTFIGDANYRSTINALSREKRFIELQMPPWEDVPATHPCIKLKKEAIGLSTRIKAINLLKSTI
jgi:hypothetical protein